MNLKAVHVSSDRWNFQTIPDGAPISPIGGNILNEEHPGVGTLFTHFDEQEIDFRLGRMAEIGLNCLRQALGINQVYHPDTGLKAEGMKNWDRLLELADKHGIYLMPVGGYIGGNDWFEVEMLSDSGKQLDDLCTFWDGFCSHYKDHPGIWAWDLKNELLYTPRPHMTTPGQSPMEARIYANLTDQWPAFLEARYGTVDQMNTFYRSTYAGFDSVPGSVDFEEKPWDPRAFDFRNYLNERGYRWCQQQCQVIRSVSPAHMICSGNNTWSQPGPELWLANGFHNRAHYDLFDFTTHHPYPAWQVLPENQGDPLDGGEALTYWLNICIGMSRLNWHEKPVVLQEFGWYGGGTSRFLCDLPFRSEQEHAEYTRVLTQALKPHINGFINWPTCDMPASHDISNHGGIFTHDMKDKALTDVYRNLASDCKHVNHTRSPATELIDVSLIGLYTCQAYQEEMWTKVDAMIRTSGMPDFRFV